MRVGIDTQENCAERRCKTDRRRNCNGRPAPQRTWQRQTRDGAEDHSGCPPTRPAANTPASYHKGLRFEVILPRPELPLIKRMNEDFMQLAPSLDRSITQRSILKDDNPAQLASRIRATKCNAIIIYAQEDAMISEAIESAAAAGIPVVIIISDLPTSSRLAYAGIDHYSAGRTAGYFMARMARRSGPVLVLCYHLAVQGHAKRVSGITDAMKADDSGWLWLNCGRGMTILKFRNGFWWTL